MTGDALRRGRPRPPTARRVGMAVRLALVPRPRRVRPMVVGVALAVVWATSAAAQRAGAWRPDERVLITAFDEVGAVATDLRRVYAATPNGIEVYDFAAERWDAPITAEDGFPVGERPTALAHDAFGDRLWIGTAGGSLYAYLPTFGRWERYGIVAGGEVVRIVVGSGMTGDDVFIATGSGWHRLRPGSAFVEPVPAARLPAGVAAEADSPERRLRRADPAFGSIRGTVTMDEQLRRWTITDAVPAHLPDRYWIGTRGGNLFLYDGRRADAEPLVYGLPSRGATALALEGDGVWFGSDGRGPRRGVAFADGRLGEWRRFDAAEGAPGDEVRTIATSAAAVWFGARDGLFRYDRAGDRWARLTERDGLPTAAVTALAAVGGGVWVGTPQGLAFVSDDGAADGETLLPGRRVDALYADAHELWVVAGARLWRGSVDRRTAAGAPTGGARRALTPVDGPAASAGRLVDVAGGLGAVWAITDQALLRFAGGRWGRTMREPAAGGLGRLRALAVSGDRVWIAGDGGAANWDPASRLWTYFRVGRDIPEGPVRAVVPDGDYVWLPTPAGALRLEWRR